MASDRDGLKPGRFAGETPREADEGEGDESDLNR
jgi:hypothetical protein